MRITASLKGEDGDFEIGSIGIQQGIGATEHWTWGIDTERTQETQGRGKDRRDCARQFKAAWERFAADEASLTEFQ
jgi:hypothetical protein